MFSDGLGPVKYAESTVLPDPVYGRYYSISLPVLRSRSRGEAYAAISAGDEHATTSQVASIYDDAEQQYKADRPKLIAAELSRNVARTLAANAADRKAAGVGALLSLVASVADQADIRIWSTLPNDIQLTRLRLAPGTYDLTVQVRGRVRVLKDVNIRAGQMTFASLQWTSLN